MAEPIMRIAGDGTRKALPRRFHFTIKSLANVTVPARKPRVWVYDAHTPRLAFMRTAAGASSFYYYAKIDGRPVRYRLGDGTLSIEQARTLAQGVLGKVASGINPQHERQRARAEMTFGELFTWYIEHPKTRTKRTWREDQAKYDLHLKDWASRRFKDISRAEVGRIHAKIGTKAPGAANRVLSLVSVLFNRAREIGYEGPNPAKGISKFPESTRERYLQADELPRFFEGLNVVSQDMRDFFTLCLLTGARRENVLSMRWSELQLPRATWTIPGEKFKTGKALTLHLVPDVVKILQRRHDARTDAAAVYVFPSNSKSGYLSEPKKAWARVLKAANLTDLRIHDLRHTFASYQAALNTSLPLVGRSLGHKSQQSTARYAHVNLDPIRLSVGAAVDAMMKLSRPTKPARQARVKK